MNHQDIQTMDPLVSVLMPVFNAEKYVTGALESILGQIFQNYEFIIIDDGSSDKTNQIIRSFMDKDPRIVLVENGINLGIIHSLNKGIQLSRGKYIARMDADDISHPSRLIKQIDYLENHPDISVLGSAMSFIHHDASETLGIQRYPTAPAMINWFLFFGNPFGHPTVMVRKNLLETAGGYREEFRFAQDYDLWTRIITLTNGSNLEEPLIFYRIHPQNVSAIHHKEQRSISEGITMKMLLPFIGVEPARELVCLSFDSVPKTKKGKIMASKAIFVLYNKFVQKSPISFKEKINILIDALNRVYRIAAEDKSHPLLFFYWLMIGISRSVALFFLQITGRSPSRNYLDVDSYRKKINIL